MNDGAVIGTVAGAGKMGFGVDILLSDLDEPHRSKLEAYDDLVTIMQHQRNAIHELVKDCEQLLNCIDPARDWKEAKEARATIEWVKKDVIQ